MNIFRWLRPTEKCCGGQKSRHGDIAVMCQSCPEVRRVRKALAKYKEEGEEK